MYRNLPGFIGQVSIRLTIDMASILRKRTVLFLCLISDAAGTTLENKCKSTVKDKSIPVVSFCKENVELNSSITLDAYLPSFGASSYFCSCEVKILSTQRFPSLRISQDSTIIPTGDCGLQLKLTNATEDLLTVQCSYFGDKEYILIQGSSIVISLAKISENWSGGFCFHFSLRFENSPISVQCFNPGVTIVPTQPSSTDTPTTSTAVSTVTNSFSSPLTTNTDTSSVTSDLTSNAKSSTVTSTSGTEPPGSTQTDFSTTSTTIFKSGSTTPGDESSTTVSDTVKIESTAIGVTGPTTFEKTSSTGKDNLTSTSVKKVISTAEFNVLYAVLPVIGVILIAIFCLVFLWYRRQRNGKDRLYNRERLQSSTVSSSKETDTHPQKKTHRNTDTANHKMKNGSEFYYNGNQLSKQTTVNSSAYRRATSNENNPKRINHYTKNKEGKDISTGYLGLDQTAKNTSHGGPNDTPVVYVTVNGGERFIL